jgi:tetratricopeptide (TPR) repeat protein
MIRLLCVLCVVAAAGCKAPKASLQVRRPPTLDLPAVQILAVDDFEGDKDAAAFVKAALIAALNREGAIEAMDIETAKEKRAAGGAQIEAILRGRVWTDFVHLQGMQEPVITSDATWEKTQQGLAYIAEVRDKIEYQPYEIVKAFVTVQINLVQLSGNEEKTIAALAGGRGYRERIGGGPARVLDLWTGTAESGGAANRSREGLLQISSQRAVESFVKAISPHTERIEAVVAKGGDEAAARMILNGKYEEAIAKLEPALKSPTEKQAPDLYNLGLAYEATGEPGLMEVSIGFYRKALAFDPTNEDYAAGIGRVEAMRRDYERTNP